MSRPSPRLLTLLAAASSLVGPAHAADEEQTALSYRYNQYDEDALPASRVSGDPGRYRIETHQFSLSQRLGDDLRLDVEGTHEAMSGSSPWFLLPGQDNQPVQVLSGATIHDSRRELQTALTLERDRQRPWTAQLSFSNEDDYHDVAIGVSHQVPLNAQLSLDWSASAARDHIDPIDPASYNRPAHEQKHSVSAALSASLVIDRDRLLQFGMQINHLNGFLADPYKAVYVAGEVVPEQRPGTRNEVALILRYRQAHAAQDAALHVDYRYAFDDWGLRSHTVDVAWYQGLPFEFRLIPALRYYSQEQANFYRPLFFTAPRDGFFSSDYRLGTYGAVSARLELRRRWGRVEWVLGAERYRSDESAALGGRDAAVPGLVGFTRLHTGIDYSF